VVDAVYLRESKRVLEARRQQEERDHMSRE
jgi:hypothetical protein